MSASEKPYVPPVEKAFIVGFIIGFIIGALACVTVAVAINRDWQIQSIQHGAAEWKVNPDGTTEFKWKEKP